MKENEKKFRSVMLKIGITMLIFIVLFDITSTVYMIFSLFLPQSKIIERQEISGSGIWIWKMATLSTSRMARRYLWEEQAPRGSREEAG